MADLPVQTDAYLAAYADKLKPYQAAAYKWIAEHKVAINSIDFKYMSDWKSLGQIKDVKVVALDIESSGWSTYFKPLNITRRSKQLHLFREVR